MSRGLEVQSEEPKEGQYYDYNDYYNNRAQRANRVPSSSQKVSYSRRSHIGNLYVLLFITLTTELTV